MKKLLFSLGLTAAMFTTAQAQQYISLGPVAGFGHSNLTNGEMGDANLDLKTKFKPSFHAGIGLIYAKHEHWGFGGELLYSQEGYRKNFSDGSFDLDATQTVGYIRVPLRVYYFFGDYQQKVRPKVYLGPSFGFKIMDDYDYEGNNAATEAVVNAIDEPLLEYKTFDLGLQAGVGVNITLAKAMWLNLDLNYYQGLLDAAEDQTSNTGVDFSETGYNMNQNLRFQVGVLFGLGK